MSYSRSLVYQLLDHEPDLYLRSNKDGSRFYKHIHSKGKIVLDLKLDETGDIQYVNLKNGDKRHIFDVAKSEYIFHQGEMNDDKKYTFNLKVNKFKVNSNENEPKEVKGDNGSVDLNKTKF